MLARRGRFSIRWRIALILAAMLALYVGVDYAIQQFVLAPHFVKLEQDAARADMKRVQEAIGSQLRHLSTLAWDWATWDDTYQYAVDHNEAYEVANLTFESAKAMSLSTIMICNTQDEIVSQQTWDLKTEELLRAPELNQRVLPPEMSPLRDVHAQGDERVGAIMTARGPMLVASRPILPSEGKGPSRGMLIMGSFLDDAALRKMAEQTGIKLSLHPLQKAPAAAREAVADLSAANPIRIAAIDDQTLQVYSLLRTLKGAPLAALEVDTDRAITRHSRVLLQHAWRSLVGAAVVALLLVMLLLEFTVIGPIAKLTRGVVTVGQTGDLDARFASHRSDEVGVLTRELNSMLGELRAARQRLLTETYREGMAEMASGVLHNVRNMETAVVAQVEEVKRVLRGGQIARLSQALDEFEQGSADAPRRAALEQYVPVATRRLIQLVHNSTEQLDSVSEQTRQIDEMLVEQERVSRNELMVSAMPVRELAEDAFKLVSDRVKRALTLEMDEQLSAAGCLEGSRPPLLLVLANLYTNAVEAVAQDSAARGVGEPAVRMWLTATRETAGDGCRVRLRFADDGPGIPVENRKKVFERGFSSKASSRGLGLHWSANVVTAMGGQLCVGDGDNGRGACFHLVMPCGEKGSGSDV